MSGPKALHALSLVPVFQTLSRDEALGLAALASVEPYRPGDIVIADGDVTEDLFVIIDGVASVYKNRALLARFRKGDVVGEMALISGQPRSAKVVMTEHGEALRLPRAVYADLIERHPEMWRDLCRLVAGRLRATTADRGIEGRDDCSGGT